MATEDQLSTPDLLRIFLLKFLSDDDLENYLDGTFTNGNIVNADGSAVTTESGSA